MKKLISIALENVATRYFTDHVHKDGRVVAIRRGSKAGHFSLTFSDPRIDLREEPNGGELRDVSLREAHAVIRHFLTGERTKFISDQFDLEINQAKRECYVERHTPTRIRISYDLPNAGTVSGWYGRVQIGRHNYVAKL